MNSNAAVTVNLPREEVSRRWQSPDWLRDASVTFTDAPGDRGTEIHVDLGSGSLMDRLKGGPALARAKDELRRFKQLAETGEIPRSDAVPEGELAERKFKQRPAQPQEMAGAR